MPHRALNSGPVSAPVKRRTLSLFRQGTEWCEAIPNMPVERLTLLMTTYDALVRRHEVFREAIGIL